MKSGSPAQKRIQQINAALIEADRFCRLAIECRRVLATDELAVWGCKEQAAMKRASMDLTRVLPQLRRSA